MEPQPLEDAEREIGIRVLRDDKFRRALLNEPEATLQREYGVEIPEGVTIQVHEETDSVIHLVVPGPPEDIAKLSELDLDDVERMMAEWGRDGTGCCTCGSSTEQTFKTLQRKCGC